MLWKLLKYDFRSMWKQFQIVWPAALVLGLVNRFTLFGFDNPGGSAFGEWAAVISLSLFGGVCFAMVVVSTVFVLNRFYKGLLGSEGYLMHTLPVKPWQLVLSKLTCALVVTAVNFVVGFGALFLMVPVKRTEFFDIGLWQMAFKAIGRQPDVILYCFEFCLLVLVAFALCFTLFYLSMAAGHLFHRRRVLMSVVTFFGLDILFSVISSSVHHLGIFWELEQILEGSGHLTAWVTMGVMLVPTVLMFLATTWILKHKLNLE